jgi:hypothetical protein
MTKEEIYKIIQEFLQKREEENILLLKEGLFVRRIESDYIIKVTKKKG